MSKKKTRPQFWVFRAGVESGPKKVGFPSADSMACPKTQNCGRDFFLWHHLFLGMDPKFQCLTLSSNNSLWKAGTTKKYHIFWILRTWTFSWSYPGKKNFPLQKCWREGNLTKNAVFANFSCPHRKNFNWLPIGQSILEGLPMAHLKA